MRSFYVYIPGSRRNGTLYIGMTNKIARRVREHREKADPGRFTCSYDVNPLVRREMTDATMNAVRRERQIKGWPRRKKIALIESADSNRNDLSKGWH